MIKNLDAAVTEAIDSRIDGAIRSVDIPIDLGVISISWNTQWSSPDRHDAWNLHTGTCVGAKVHYTADETVKATGDMPGRQWRIALVADRMRPVGIQGVSDDDLRAAVAVLADTVRAAAVHARLVTARREHTRRVLADAAADYRALTDVPLNDRPLAPQERLDSLVQRALVNRDLSRSEIRDITGLGESHIQDAADQADEARGWTPRTPLYLGIDALAARAGVTPATIRSYRARDDAGLPQEDITLGGNPGWEWDTVERWIDGRRGRGWAAGTTADLTGRRH